MTQKKKIDKVKIADTIICVAVFIQPALILLQQVLIRFFAMPEEATTIYRELLTAIPLSVAILISAKREPLRFIITYLVVMFIILFTITVFPQNEPYIQHQGFRFLLPVVIPSALCLMTVRNFSVIEPVLLVMAWISSFFVLVCLLAFFMGRHVIEGYDMSFSYGCLLPMIVLYSQKKIIPLVVCALMFLTVISIGSRGAALVFVAFVAFDMIRNKSKKKWIPLMLGIGAIVLLPLLGGFLESIGIHSRTLYLFGEGEIVAHDSGRGNIYDYFIDILMQHPIMGIGIYGDRVYIGGSYCHNVILEILLDFGLFLGSTLILFSAFLIAKTYFRAYDRYRDLLVMIAFISICPLMASGSYLNSHSLALLFGMIYLINKEVKKNKRMAIAYA